MISICLPFPPSTNKYWRSIPIGNRAVKVVISKAGREYTDEVARILAASGIQQKTGELFARYDLYPPDRRTRDIDNFDSKALNDALTKAGLLVDDSQIRGKVSWFHDNDIHKGGRVVVQLVPLELVRDIYEKPEII